MRFRRLLLLLAIFMVRGLLRPLALQSHARLWLCRLMGVYRHQQVEQQQMW